MADIVDQALPQNQLSTEQLMVLKQGPPIKHPPAGYYEKTRGNSAGMVKYFKNGHPQNNSEWIYMDPQPYYK
jgi:hypothetical protein